MAHQIILADSQVIFRTGAARVLAREDDFTVAVQCADVERLKEAVDSQRRSIVIFPTSFTSDLSALLQFVEHAGSKSVLILEHGAHLDEDIAGQANGVVLRSVGGRQLVECLRLVAAGERSVQRPEPRRVAQIDKVGARVLNRLTPRELQIVALVTSGAKNRDIAEQLGTKEQVVKNYLRTIYDKTGVSDRLELTIFTQHHRTLADAALRARQELAAA